MPKLSQTVNAQPRTIDDLSPSVRAHLEATIATYKELDVDIELLKHQQDIEHLTIGKILEDEGIDKAEAEEMIMYWTRDGKTTRLDKMKLIEQGITTAQIEKATVETPKKPFFTMRGKKA
jgi:hypothetical protein